MDASQSYWSRLDKSSSAGSGWKPEGGFVFGLRFVQHKQDAGALLRLRRHISALLFHV